MCHPALGSDPANTETPGWNIHRTRRRSHDGDARVEGAVDDANHRRHRAFQRVERGAEGASEAGSPVVFVPSIAVRYKFVSSIATPFYT